MKKAISAFFVFVLLLSLSACACSHQWEKATCTTPETCSLCQKTEGEALGHSWQEASCARERTCSLCGVTEGEKLEHTWQEATCTEARRCTVCGTSEGEPLSHSWQEAKCTEAEICTVCGEIGREAPGHSWENAVCTLCGLNAQSSGYQQCPVCTGWYPAGEEYMHHTCVGYSIACPICGEWYEAGYAFLSHPCASAETSAAAAMEADPTKLQCPVCTGWYPAGDEYMHHKCVDYSVACPACGNWFEAGYALLSHSCAIAATAPTAPQPPASLQNPVSPPADTGVGEQQQCQTCGKTFAAGREFDTHFCQYIPATCYKCMMSMPSWQLNSHDCPSANLQPRLCVGCGESFLGYSYDAHICPGNKINRVPCPICSVLYDEGAQLDAHMAGCTPTPVTCEYCGGSIAGNILGEHLMTCPSRPGSAGYTGE